MTLPEYPIGFSSGTLEVIEYKASPAFIIDFQSHVLSLQGWSYRGLWLNACTIGILIPCRKLLLRSYFGFVFSRVLSLCCWMLLVSLFCLKLMCLLVRCYHVWNSMHLDQVLLILQVIALFDVEWSRAQDSRCDTVYTGWLMPVIQEQLCISSHTYTWISFLIFLYSNNKCLCLTWPQTL